MQDSQKVFLDIIHAFIGDTAIIDDSDTDWIKVISIAQEQSLSGILFPVVSRSKIQINPKELTLIESAYNQTIMKSIDKDYVFGLIKTSFNKAEIPHIPIKGSVVKRFYPIQELRSMGDIDILIHEKDFERAHETLVESGFKKIDSGEVVWTYKLGNIMLELHTQIKYIFLDRRDRYELLEVWKNVLLENNSGYTYILTSEYNFFVGLAHMAKHLWTSGCGFRYVLDLAFMLKYCSDWNMQNLLLTCERYGLITLLRTISGYCKEIFNVDIPCELTKDSDPELLDALTAEFFADATHGKSYIPFVDEYLAYLEKTKSLGGIYSKIAVFWKRAFPPLSYLKKSCHYVESCVILAPIGYVHRMIRLLYDKDSREAARDTHVQLKNITNENISEGYSRIKLRENLGLLNLNDGKTFYKYKDD